MLPSPLFHDDDFTAMRVQLLCENVGFSDLEFEIMSHSLVLGRSLRADVQVVHPLISRLHCEWKLLDGEVMVRDLESTNHTLVNGEPVQQAVLQSGDRILLGDVLYIVEIQRGQPPLRESPSEDFPPLHANSNSDSEHPTTRLTMENVSWQAEA